MHSIMKRLYAIILVGFCLFMATPTETSAQFKFGIKGGVNLSERPTNIKGIKDGHTGWYAGPMVKFITPAIGLGVEANALYSKSGASIGGETFDKTSIEIPLYLRYELTIPLFRKFMTPFFAIGPQWGYTFGEREFGKQLSEINSIDDIKDISDRYFKFNRSCFSLNLGLGFVFFNHLQLHANYNIALGETCEFFGKDNFKLGEKLETIKSKSNIWQLSVAYIF